MAPENKILKIVSYEGLSAPIQMATNKMIMPHMMGLKRFPAICTNW